MTDAADGQNAVDMALAWRDAALFSCSAGEHKLMKHFVVKFLFLLVAALSRRGICNKTIGGCNGKSINESRAGTDECLLAGVQLSFCGDDLSQG
jgi:hypothetical protein